MNLLETILIANLLSSLMMAGIIWFVQIVHYPLFAKVPTDLLVEYERSHSRRTGVIVVPLMLVELLTTVILCLPMFNHAGSIMPLVGAAILAVVWMSTFAIQLPLHKVLSKTGDYVTVCRLVSTNWVRTFGWSARSVIATLMLFLNGGLVG